MMVSMLIYVFAIVLNMFLKDIADEEGEYFFSTLPRCMWTLLVNGTLLDAISDPLNALVSMGEFNTTISVIIFFIFVLLSALTVMNMLIGVLCEVVSAVAASEREEADITELKMAVLQELKKFNTGR